MWHDMSCTNVPGHIHCCYMGLIWPEDPRLDIVGRLAFSQERKLDYTVLILTIWKIKESGQYSLQESEQLHVWYGESTKHGRLGEGGNKKIKYLPALLCQETTKWGSQHLTSSSFLFVWRMPLCSWQINRGQWWRGNYSTHMEPRIRKPEDQTWVV